MRVDERTMTRSIASLDEIRRIHTQTKFSQSQDTALLQAPETLLTYLVAVLRNEQAIHVPDVSVKCKKHLNMLTSLFWF